MASYDVAYQEWVQARRDNDYGLADKIREQFERDHGLTIFAVGDMPLEGVTVHRMRKAVWEKKYGSPEVGKLMETWDSFVKHVGTSG